MAIKRTQDEILNRITEREPMDFFGWEHEEYAVYLDKEHVKNFLKEGADIDKWEPSAADPLDKIRDYMDFAWDKANNQRGISASRSTQHMIAWLWLAGEDELAEWADDERNYYHYGKPILERICDFLGIDWRVLDDGVRTNG